MTIDGGAGSDTISNSGANVLFQYTGGNDYIGGFNSTSTLQIMSGGISAAKSDGTDLFLTVGQDTITLKNAAELNNLNIVDAANNAVALNVEYKIMGTSGNDVINNHYENATINALGGNDVIDNSGESAVINGGTGRDSINNQGNNVSIIGDAGNDYISNHMTTDVSISGGADFDSIYNYYVERATVSGDDGYDYIYNNGTNVSINGGSGDDSIENVTLSIWNSEQQEYEIFSPDNVTIEGGAGNDYINNIDGLNVLFRYKEGDGSDIIDGFRADSTLLIGGGSGTYLTQLSGDDVIVNVGDGSINLRGAATLSAVNIEGVKSELPAWRLNGTTATYGTSTETLLTISGIISTAGLSINDTVVTVDESALNQSDMSISSGYSLTLASGISAPSTSAATWNLNNNVATYNGAIPSTTGRLNTRAQLTARLSQLAASRILSDFRLMIA